ncbi:hypothetical protein [Nonomuraea endophytica]|uniref:hypothetical protein n=1 Tax=Nonomuraea endophytica TaxID=714136 RepID=UPI0037C9E8E9
MTHLTLDADGPRSAAYTRQVAAGLAECMHVLAHHTTSDGPTALPDLDDVRAVIEALHTAASLSDQLIDQLEARLAVMAGSGRVADMIGRDPATVLTRIVTRLGGIRLSGRSHARRLSTVHADMLALYLSDGEPS